MADYGFLIKDTAGHTILDDRSFAYTVSDPLTLLWRGDDPITPCWNAPSEPSPVLFGLPVSHGVAWGPMGIRASRLVEGEWVLRGEETMPDARLMIPFRDTPSPGYGLQVFSPSGETCFHSGDPLISIRGAEVVATGAEWPGDGYSASIPSNTTHIAFSPSVKGIGSSPAFGAPWYVSTVRRISATSLVLTYQTLGGPNIGLQGPFPTTFPYLAARVVI